MIEAALDRMREGKRRLDQLSVPPADGEDVAARLRWVKECAALQTEIDASYREARDAMRKALTTLDQKLGKAIQRDIPTLIFSDSDGGSLDENPRLSQFASARLNDLNLENDIRRLTDMITMRHIKEEMDSNNYLNRVNQSFTRLLDDSRALADRIGYEVGPDNAKPGLMAKLGKLQERLDTDVPEEWRRDFPEINSIYEQMNGQLNAIRNLLISLRDLAAKDLVSFCQDANRDYVRRVTREAAVKAEKSPLASPWVLLAAAAAFLSAQLGITSSRSFMLMDNRVLILVSAVAGMALLSAYIGARYREDRVEELHWSMREKLMALTDLEARVARSSWLRLLWRPYVFLVGRTRNNALKYMVNSVFPSFEVQRFVRTPIRNAMIGVGTRFDVSRGVDKTRDIHRRAFVGVVNVTAITLISLLLSLDWSNWPKIFPSDAAEALIGRDSNGRYCILESGNITRVNDDYVVVYTAGAGNVQIDRGAIHRIEAARSDKMEIERGLERCDADDGAILTRAGDVTNNWSVFRDLRLTDPRMAAMPGGAELTKLTDSLGRLGDTLREIGPPIMPVLITMAVES